MIEERNIADRFFQNSSCCKVMLFPVGGIELFNADMGTGGRAVNEAPFPEINAGVTAVGSVGNAEDENISRKELVFGDFLPDT